MNQKAIEEAIAQWMKTETGGNPTMRAAAYMEKLCQNVWRLPAVREPEQVLCELLEQTIEDEAIRGYIRQGLSVPVPGEGTPPSTYQCLPPNPRRLKGMANLIGRLSPRLPQIAGPAMHFETQLLVIVAYIYQFHHDLYVRWEADPKLYDIIYEWCSGANYDHDFLKRLQLPLLVLDREPLKTESTYPDPAEANIFWIQSLILHLGTEAAPQRFKPYLHGVPT